MRGKRRNESKLWVLAFLGSLLLNLLFVCVVAVLYVKEMTISLDELEKRNVIAAELVRVIRDKDSGEGDKDKEEIAANDEEDKKISYIRTIKEQESADAPPDPAYVGQRNTRLANERDGNPDGLENLPTTEGEKRKDDSAISLIDQRGQLGDLEHDTEGHPGEGPRMTLRRDTRRDAPEIPPVPVPPVPQIPQVPDVAGQPADQAGNETGEGQDNSPDAIDPVLAADGTDAADKDGREENTRDGTNQDIARVAPETTDKVREAPRDIDAPETNEDDPDVIAEMDPAKRLEELMKSADPVRLPDAVNPIAGSPLSAAEMARQGGIRLPSLPPSTAPVYDPAFPDGARPGYKHESRKTRITGRMSTRGVVAADVKSTPLGVYLSYFLQALNRKWDIECTVNREFIIPGSMKIRMVLNRDGNTSGIRLMNIQNASEVQKSFTFKAIQETSLPPMPPEVLNELGEDNTEIIIDFYF